jgi:hypothetical protein
MDRNDYYGGESASVNLVQLFERFGAGTPSPELGSSRDYNIDLAPKFIMANGNLVRWGTFPAFSASSLSATLLSALFLRPKHQTFECTHVCSETLTLNARQAAYHDWSEQVPGI